MYIKVFNGYFFNFDNLWLNTSNFTFKMTHFLIGPKFNNIFPLANSATLHVLGQKDQQKTTKQNEWGDFPTICRR